MNTQTSIRRAAESDFDAMWPIFQAVIAAGDTYTFESDTPMEVGFAYWFGPGISSYVAEENGLIVGMYKIVANQPGRGSHVANASFMVSPAAQGQGIGKTMAQHCLIEARKAGFHAMQFNIVVSINEAAIALWKKLGFEIVGTLPKAFHHSQLGFVDAYVMYRSLEDVPMEHAS